MHVNRIRQAEKLKRRFAKVLQYVCGIRNLIKHGTGETTLDLDDDYLEAMLRALEGKWCLRGHFSHFQ